MDWTFDTSIVVPGDASFNPVADFIEYYKVKYGIAKRIRPKRIMEIGVRAGYSAYSFLSACPEAYYLGIDAENGSWGGGNGPWNQYARKTLSKFDAEFIIADSQKIKELHLKPFDLIHIDGDHSFQGATNDLNLCSKVGKNLLVDDYDFIPSVRKAVDLWLAGHKDFTGEYIKSLRGEMLISRD
jgi:hypothetical protein